MKFSILIFSMFFNHLFASPTFYVNSNNSNEFPDGSIEDPFLNLYQAINMIGPQEADIILLGENIVINSSLTIPSQSNYRIRGLATPSRDHFPIIFKDRGSIDILECTLSFENVQIVEYRKQYYIPIIQIQRNGKLIFNRVLVQDLQTASDYLLLSISENSELFIIESKFSSLTNPKFTSRDSNITIIGSTFTDIRSNEANIYYPAVFIFTKCQVTLQNNTFDMLKLDIIFFLISFQKNDKSVLQDFNLQNSIVNTGFSFIMLVDSGNFEIKNGIFQNITEEAQEGDSEVGLLINEQNTNLTLENITFKNCGFNKGPALNTLQISDNPALIVIRDILIQTSLNIRFVNRNHSIVFENILITDTSCTWSPVDSQGGFNPILSASDTNSVSIRNIRSENVHGPFFDFSNVNYIEISNCTFENSTTSQVFPFENRNFLKISKQAGLPTSNNFMMKLRNFNVNGYTELNEINEVDGEYEVEYASIIHLNVHVGVVSIEDSHWNNINTISIFGEFITSLQISNLTIDADPNLPSWEIPKRRMFYFENVEKLRMADSQIINNQNLNLLQIFNPLNFDSFQINNPMTISFENTKIINNTAIFSETASISPALFDLYMLINSLIIELKTSIFRNNKIKWRNLFITASKYNVSSVNNIYQNNSAKGSGGVGYLFNTDLIYSEINGIYNNLSAGVLGGSWYFSINLNTQAKSIVKFWKTAFKNNKASKGGVVYVAQGDISIMDCIFEENFAANSGGDIYVLKSSSIEIESTAFKNSSASKGSWLYVEEISKQIFKNISVSNFTDNLSASTLANFNFGTLFINDALFQDISISLFSFISANVTFERIEISKIICGLTSQSFCLLEGTTLSLKFSDSVVKDVVSCKNLISISSNEEILFRNIEFSNTNGLYDQDSELQYALSVTSAQGLIVQDSRFFNSSFSAIQIKESNLQISHSVFSNFDRKPLTQALDKEMISTVKNHERVFIVLSSSNSSILQTTFIGGLTEALDGGVNLIYIQSDYLQAIRIVGNKGIHRISGSSFQRNKASNGGAIGIEGNENTIEILNSDFTDNQATVSGGCLFFSNQSVQNFVKIDEGKFKNNKGQRGGCLFLGNQSSLIEESNFTSNFADKGAVIASNAEETQKRSTIRGSSFIENSAFLGSSLMAYGKMNFDIINTTFFNNKGENLATQPEQLRVKIYEFDKIFLHLENVTPEILFAHNETKLVFDSMSSDSTILSLKTGISPNYIFVFSALDDLGQDTIVTSSQLKLSLRESVNQGDIHPSLIGKTVYDLKEGSQNLMLYDDFSIRGSINSTITLSAELTLKDDLTNLDRILSPVELKVLIVPCTQGEIYDQVNVMCLPCAEGTYSLEDPFKAETCQICNGPVVCKGSNIIYPQKGYWRIDRDSDNVIKCFNEEACLGGETDGGTRLSFSGFCEKGYEGTACASCNPDYAKFGISQTCVNCKTDRLYFIKFAAFFIIQVVGIALMIKKLNIVRTCIYHKRLIGARESFQRQKILIVKLIIDFIQILNLTSELSLNWPESVSILLSVLSKIVPDSREAVSIDCFISLVQGNNSNVFFIKVLVLVLQPIVFLLFGIGFWVCFYKLDSKRVFGNPELMANIRITISVIIYILQPYIIKATFQLFNCQNFASTFSPKYYMIEDANVECWQSNHIKWALGLGVSSLTLWLLLPSLALNVLIKRKKELSSKAFEKKYGLILTGYDSGFAYWEDIILGIKFLLIIYATFVKDEYLRIYLVFLSLVLVYCLQVKIKPFASSGLNIAQQLSLLTTLFLFYNALFFVPDYESKMTTNILLSLNFLTATLFFGYCLYLLYKSIKEKVKNINQRKAQPKLRVQKSRSERDIESIFKQSSRPKVEDVKSFRMLNPKDNLETEFATSSRRRRFSLIIAEDLQNYPVLATNEIPNLPSIHFNMITTETKHEKELYTSERFIFTDVRRTSFDSFTDFEEKQQGEKYLRKITNKSEAKGGRLINFQEIQHPARPRDIIEEIVGDKKEESVNNRKDYIEA